MATAAMPLRPPHRRAIITPPVVATSNDGDLPLDLLYEILLRLPAQAICRFRAVCRSWRSLLGHPEFIAAAHNPGPLLAVGVKDSSYNEVHVLDMESGEAVKHVKFAADKAFLPPRYGDARAMSYDRVVCLVGPNQRLRLLDLTSGALSILPSHDPPQGYSSAWGVVGRAASTGENKVFVISTSYFYNKPQACKILTLGVGNGGWRDTGSPPLEVMLQLHSKRVTVINDVAYFLSWYTRVMSAHQIAMFDFSSEAWRPEVSSLQGPINRRDISLAQLDGCLVASHANSHTSIELWFLVDLDRSQWSKRYTINMSCNQNLRQLMCKQSFEKPLAMLGDGRIVLLMRVAGLGYPDKEAVVLRIYNPRTKTCRDGTWVPNCNQFSVFTWSLLHSAQQGPLDIAAKRLLLCREHQKSGATISTDHGHNKKRRTK
ncbi:hypothetical protein QYE76_007427 [Lolium multiflorum]|uniref:F-box domain-containing protein n=1 Tax=Lolium multiflorum TaxID=4521 RepID=A0AAD8RYA0_LOLMU|nr:hypothetical protein QYE76_007427 [Lolium multiflorum]